MRHADWRFYVTWLDSTGTFVASVHSFADEDEARLERARILQSPGLATGDEPATGVEVSEIVGPRLPRWQPCAPERALTGLADARQALERAGAA